MDYRNITACFIFSLFFIPSLSISAEFKNDNDKLSYSLGFHAGSIFIKNPNVDYNIEHFKNGLLAGLTDAKPELTKEQMGDVIKAHQMAVLKKQEEEREVLAQKNLEAGNQFLQNNGKKDNIITTVSGLQYEILSEGKGKKPGLNDSVLVNYIGSDIHEKEFANTYNTKPSNFRLTALSKGWREALLMMNEGSKWRLYLPTDLAYGAKGAMPKIEPNAALIFDVELLEVK